MSVLRIIGSKKYSNDILIPNNLFIRATAVHGKGRNLNSLRFSCPWSYMVVHGRGTFLHCFRHSFFMPMVQPF